MKKLEVRYDPADLPEVLTEIHDLLGLEKTMALVVAMGGTEVCVPCSLAIDHPLVDALGIEAAEKLAWHFRSCKIYVPKAQAMQRRARDRAILHAYENGATVKELAKMTELNFTRIYKILKAPTAPPRSQKEKLFGYQLALPV